MTLSPVLQVIILGLVQGVTEFLPVSSSGHLVIVPYLLSLPQPPLAFDVALHFGTLLAVIAYFAGDLWWLATRSVGYGATVEGEVDKARRTVVLLAIGSVPAALVGLLLESVFEGAFGSPRLVAGFLVVTAGILLLAERVRRRRAAAAIAAGTAPAGASPARLDLGRHEGTTSFTDALAIGAAQALAILPGISRSGATIATGMLRGMSREAAARFSFLLAIPVILGATILEVPSLFGDQVDRLYTGSELAIGVGVAAVSGFWAIRFLLRLVATDDLSGFARYCLLFAGLTFVGTLWIGPPGT